jgi:hypothetical protein
MWKHAPEERNLYSRAIYREERHLVVLHGLENVSLVVRHVEAFQQLDVFFVEALASMMLLLILNVYKDFAPTEQHPDLPNVQTPQCLRVRIESLSAA